MKTDARVRYTKKVIQESFLKLIKETPVNKITVKSICDLSEINRATFYRYYTDPYDLLRQIENEFILAMQSLIESSDNVNITHTVIKILKAIKQDGEMYTALISNNGDNTFIKRVLTESFRIKKPSMEELFPAMPQNHQEWFYYFMSNGFISILIAWIQGGMQEDPKEVAQFINRINNILLKEI